MPTELINNVEISYELGITGAKLHLVDTQEKFDAFFKLLMQQKLVACDTETSGFQWFKDHHMVGASFGWDKEHFYLPFRHEASLLGGKPGPQLDMKLVHKDLCTFFAQTTVFTLWHNMKFDAHFYQREGIPIKTPFHDTRILWHFLDENAPGRLKAIAAGWKDEFGRKHAGIVHPDAGAKEKEIDTWRSEESKARRKAFTVLVVAAANQLASEPEFQGFTALQRKKHVQLNVLHGHQYADATKDSVHYGCIPLPLMSQYAGLDTLFTFAVYKHCIKEIAWTPKLQELYINECKLCRTLQRVEEAGVRIDAQYLRDQGEAFALEEEALKQKIALVLGETVNLASPQQLSEALVAHGVHLTDKSDTGNLSVDKSVLQKLSANYPVVTDLLRLRTVRKLYNTYILGILEKLVDGNILHCNFNQNVSTGRMSSSDPNLQNIPGQDDTIRRAFVPWDDEYVYLFVDYSQIEVRLTAHYSEDPLLLDAYARGQDIHTRTMCEVFGYFYEEAVKILSDEKHPDYKKLSLLRTITKRINFGIIYGVGAPGLSEQIPRPEEFRDLSERDWIAQCQKYIDNYLAKYLGVKRFVNRASREVKHESVVTNAFGRVRHLPHAKATKIYKNPDLFWMEARAQRQGVNFIIQGTAADLFKVAIVRVDDYLQGTKSKIVNLVHDEIQIYLHKSELHLLPGIQQRMEDFPEFIVPITADFSWTKDHWAAKQKVKNG